MRYGALVVGLCGVASASIFARYGLGTGFPPEALAAWRLIFAALALGALQLARRADFRLPRADLLCAGVAGIFMAVHFATWIASLDYISVARSTLLVSTSPLWAGLAGLAVPSLKPRPVFWLGLAIAAGGAYLVTMQQGAIRLPAGPAWIGDLLAVVGAICIVPYLVLSQQVQTRIGTVRTITWIYTAGALSLLLFLAPQKRLPLPPSPQVWVSILGMAAAAQLLGHGLLNYCLRHFSAAQVAAASLLEPVFAAALAWIFLAEPVSLAQAAGGALLLGGVGLSLRPEPGM
ncbi:MAG TPA: DMT family transporter [Fimbriimonadaceae bacterium]|nr:DMT family transporter [Fimbriimonadaceae bacterium]